MRRHRGWYQHRRWRLKIAVTIRHSTVIVLILDSLRVVCVDDASRHWQTAGQRLDGSAGCRGARLQLRQLLLRQLRLTIRVGGWWVGRRAPEQREFVAASGVALILGGSPQVDTSAARWLLLPCLVALAPLLWRTGGCSSALPA